MAGLKRMQRALRLRPDDESLTRAELRLARELLAIQKSCSHEHLGVIKTVYGAYKNEKIDTCLDCQIIWIVENNLAILGLKSGLK